MYIHRHGKYNERVLQEFNTSREKKIPNNVDIIRRHGIRGEKKRSWVYDGDYTNKIVFVVGSTLFLIKDFLFNKRDGKVTNRKEKNQSWPNLENTKKYQLKLN